MKVITEPDKITLETQICGHCGYPLEGTARWTGHSACRKAIVEEQMTEDARIRQKQDIEMFGHVVSEKEHYMRTHADSVVDTTTKLTWNQTLAKAEEDRKQEYQKKLAAKYDRKERQLPRLLQQLRSLENQIAFDEREEEASGE